MKRLLFLFLICFSSYSYAFKFSPMSVSLGLTESSSSALFYLENESGNPIAVQLSLAKREMTEDGQEINQKINDELSVYPSQLIIQPNEKRSVKVTWMTKFVPQKELAYRLIAEQLPIELEKSKAKKASIKVLLKYIAALYVTAEGFSPDLSLTGFVLKDDKAIFTVQNKGLKHQVLNNLTMKIVTKNNKEIDLKGEELKGMTGENVLAGMKRNFILPLKGKLAELSPNDKVKISFEKD